MMWEGTVMRLSMSYETPYRIDADYSHATTEHISSVFSTGTSLSRGIRSLPDALSPDFRQKLYEQLVESGRRYPPAAGRGIDPHTHST